MIGEDRAPFGTFLDSLPKALYVAAHVLFLGIGVWVWLSARGHALPHANVLLLYAVSQVVFFGYFANLFTLKMAVLAEQTLMVVMMVLLAL